MATNCSVGSILERGQKSIHGSRLWNADFVELTECMKVRYLYQIGSEDIHTWNGERLLGALPLPEDLCACTSIFSVYMCTCVSMYVGGYSHW